MEMEEIICGQKFEKWSMRLLTESVTPEHGYTPRHANEIYRLRAFSISPKGALIKHGDHMASRRSRQSSAGSTTNTSRQASR